MSIADFFRFGGAGTSTLTDLPEIFTFQVNMEYFIKADIMALFKKIFTDCIERTYGIKEKDEPALWDNCLASESNLGLISRLSDAMYNKCDLFLVYKQNVLRLADQEEMEIIKNDYEKKGSSNTGIYVTFQNLDQIDLLKIYSAMEYCVLASLNKSMNLSKSIQFKVADLRKSVAEFDKDFAVNQARSIATGLSQGKDIIIDASDEIITSKPEMESTEKSINFINQKKAFILGLPQAYMTGEQTGGMGASGEQDMRAIERGLKNYFTSILEPVIEALFGYDISFKSQDFRLVSSGLEALKTFELVSEELITSEEKRTIISKLFNFDVV